MKLIRISALVLTGAVAVALTACEPKEDSASSSGDKSSEASDQGGKDEDKEESGSGSSSSKDKLAGDVTTVTLTKSGGFAGNEETLEIDAEGKWSYVKAKMATKKGDLSSKELKQLIDLAGTKGITDTNKKSDKQCNDMPTFQLKVELSEGKPVEMKTDECGVAPNEEFDNLIELLTDATPI
ncbi:hypothetical protein [Stackebrandtia nassauensis]|uniref:Lipoprotein n=1 Tax=Stackebrandtia nassauensis (strain DSM 44728 / CIP 108903 / NRRL B-16338 / NBRC 102104 / LLR-40K-21) TaxID=446470 RepID=D3PY04_STANL|nr:hypothetical protein [Stackebrandtia nassauensis]ADD45333.1 hypothetical protein Snas_5703 [Stackebrandtia nassauensis DSM 44728]